MRKTAVIFVTLLLCVACYARTISVDPNGSAEFPAIKPAVNAANSGDVIIVAPGTYTGSDNKNISFGGKALLLSSEDGPQTCIIDCQRSGRGFAFTAGEDPNSVVQGFTIKNGKADYGAGVYCKNSGPKVDNCIITNNSSPYRKGGGIYCEHSDLQVTNSIISDNYTGDDGGGIFCDNDSDITISNCIIMNNIASEDGGGLEFWYHSTPEITNCVIAENRAGRKGGAIGCFVDSIPTLRNCTIVANKGGGLSTCTGPIENCILWNNEPYDLSGSSQPIYSCYKDGTTGVGNIASDPLFIDTSEGNYHLSVWSLCVNSGNPTGEIEPNETDIDGEPRVINGRIDIGSDEFDYEGPILEVSADKFIFYGFKEGIHPEPQILTISNEGTEKLVWEISDTVPWLEVYPASGETTDMGSKVTLSADFSDMQLGRYECELTVASEAAIRTPRTIFVVLYILSIDAALYIPTEYDTIQAALDTADEGDIVIVEPGQYIGYGNRDIDFKGKRVTLRSIDPNNPDIVSTTIIDCQASATNKHRAFYFHSQEDANSMLAGFTLKKGYSSVGASIYCNNSSPTISNCIISKYNVTGLHYDAIVYLKNSWSTIKNCVIRNNRARKGSGIYLNNSSPIIEHCIISDNYANHIGGGIYSWSSNPIIRYCAITNNRAASHNGGGIYCGGRGTPNIYNCRITSNTSGNYGGGICLYGNLFLTNCLIADNDSYQGGAIFCSSNSAVFSNCTFVGNVAYYGGAIYGGRPKIRNCILWNDDARVGPDEIYASAEVSYSNVHGGFVGENNINADPLFIDPEIDDYHLSPGSPCIDAGDPNYQAEPNEKDLDGLDRIVSEQVDLGAYETNYLKTTMHCTPQSLSFQSQGKYVKAHFTLPEGFNIEDVDANATVKIQLLDIESEFVDLFINAEGLVQIDVAFDRSKFCSRLGYGATEVTVVGLLRSGQYFYGKDRITVKCPGDEHLGVLASFWLEGDCRYRDWCEGADMNHSGVVDFADFAMFGSCCFEPVSLQQK